jgi:ankyrin repeat protein
MKERITVLGLLLVLLVLFMLTACMPPDRRSKEEIAFDILTGRLPHGEDKYPGSLAELERMLQAGHSPDYMAPPPWRNEWNSTSPLWSLCYYYEPSKLLIQYGADVNNRPYIGKQFWSRTISEKYPDETLLQKTGIRHEKDKYKVIKLFLEAGADPNIKIGSSALLLIQTDRHYRNYFNRTGTLPINEAIDDNLFSIVELLLEYGAVLDKESLESAKEATAKSGSPEMEEYIQAEWEKRFGKLKKEYPFYYANLKEAETLLEAGENPNRMKYPSGEDRWRSGNPLWRACGYGYGSGYEVMELLVRYGADVTRRPYIAKTVDTIIISERYPDAWVESGIRYKEAEVYRRIKLLLEAGADPNMKGAGYPARLLIGSDRNYRRWFNKHGELPINSAIEDNLFSIVELLLEYGAVLDDQSLESAKEAKGRSGSPEMEEYIKAVWERQRGCRNRPYI